MATMVLGGLWHGASWNFVIWGALHGGALAVNRAWSRRTVATPHIEHAAPQAPYRTAAHEPGKPAAAANVSIGHILAIVATFHFVCFAWIFFRAPTFGHATLMLARMGKLTVDSPNLAPKVLAVLALGFVTHFLPRRMLERTRDEFIACPAVVQGIALAVCAYVLHFASGAKAEPFIYGQF
jgi:D-alanyl-lipoteichoic acid acyltransferase DltB (MBOAT superfamily)